MIGFRSAGWNTSDSNEFAVVLAKYGCRKDVSVWAWDFDCFVKEFKQSQGPLPTRICNASDDRIASHFAGKQSGGNFPLSVACAGISAPNFDYSSRLNSKFLCFCSRGLYSDDDTGGNWGGKGGLLAFFDDHVEWFNNIVGKFKQ
jgi:hypothetical protein